MIEGYLFENGLLMLFHDRLLVCEKLGQAAKEMLVKDD
jgi:hypothetical protein